MSGRLLFLLLAVPLTVLVATQIIIFQQSPIVGEWLYPLLIANIILIVVMLIALATAAVQFWRRWRQGEGGTRLASRLTGLFLAIAFLPAAVLYVVSAGGIFRGIESWFSMPLGHAFDEGETFGKHVLGLEFNRLFRDARNLAKVLDGGQSLPFWRYDLQLLYQVDDIIIYDIDGAPLASAIGEEEPLGAPVLKELRRNRAYRNVSKGPRRNLEIIIPMPSQRKGYALKVARALPEGIDLGLSEVERGRQAYQNLLILRRGLHYSFIATLTLSFMIVVTAALWASTRLGANLFQPLTRMAKAAAAVGRGDFRYRLPVGAQDDEIAQLSREFNSMVDDLQQTRLEIAERQETLSKTKTYLENLLESLTVGVLTVDANGRLVLFNKNATPMLGVDIDELTDLHFDDWDTLPQIADMICEIVSGGDDYLERRMPATDGRMLVVRLRRLPEAGGGGVLVMIADISRQMEEERELVWQEASQRFAHEIKNPLTPIQLAAERLQNKLMDKLGEEEQTLLRRLSGTITNQVDAMREMVDAFRLYAGQKSGAKAAKDLNAIAAEVAQLYERPGLILQTRWDNTLPPLKCDAVLLRQVLHNLLGNALEAATAATDSPRIMIMTEHRCGQAVVLVEDNGGGIPSHINIFTPYQTTKEKGTGLGLAIVRKIMDSHEGTVKLENIDGGTRATLIFPL